VRGGFGSAHVVPLLDGRRMQAAPKLFIGYSDNTTVLSWLTCHLGIPGLHGPMVDRRLSRGAAGYDQRSFTELLRGGRGLQLAPDDLLVLRGGAAEGPLFGGTITQLVASLGTPYAFDPPPGSILFLEDVNERPYRLDRMLTQLAHSGILTRASALVFGEMRGCDEPVDAADVRRPASGSAPSGTASEAVTARAVIDRLARDFPGPVIVGFPSGHTTGPGWTLPLGVRVRVNTAPRPSIAVEESPVD
jgi:muramoyltetrapeptide carboxypeptidase